MAETTDESPGNTRTLNGVGTRLYGNKAKCPACRSVIKRKCFCLIFIPIIPLKQFRVKPVTATRYTPVVGCHRKMSGTRFFAPLANLSDKAVRN